MAQKANYDIRQLQEHLTNNLREVNEALNAASLRHYIVAGTLLGAVRHGGFIPWDDDVDIAMPRSDYETFRLIWPKILPPHYEFVCPENDEKFRFPFGRIFDTRTTLIERNRRGGVTGVFIDVFPIDGVPDDEADRRRHFDRILRWWKILFFVFRDPFKRGHGPSSWLPLLIQKFHKPRETQERMRDMLMEYDYDTSKYVSEHYNRRRTFHPREVFGRPTPIKFEGIEVMGVEHPDLYLSRTYGDYMKLPPEDQRRQHLFDYLDLNKSYKTYSD